MMITDPIGLYVHIPFCKRKCNYCDFCSSAAKDDDIERYIDALIREIDTYKSPEKKAVDSVFFGGGTPSLLEPCQFLRIVRAIRDVFDISDSAEFTVEVNPKTLNAEKLRAFVDSGVNRISIGMQSIHENEQKILGRIHNYEDFEKTFGMIRDAGIDNINVDIMYGIPEQTEASFNETLHRIISLSPEHISCYGLIIEEDTPFYRMREKLALPSEDEEVAMYYLAHDLLTGSGYSHYEISNYAKDGRTCRHNLKYWHNREYIGIGLAAHSFYGDKRYSNTEELGVYLSGAPEDFRNIEERDSEDVCFEYAMLALRLAEGIDLLEYRELFGHDFSNGREELISKYVGAGLMELSCNRLKLSHRGFYVSSAIMAELL